MCGFSKSTPRDNLIECEESVIVIDIAHSPSTQLDSIVHKKGVYNSRTSICWNK